MKPLEKVRELLAKESIDGIFIHQPENLLYITGFRGTFGGAFITETKAVVLVDSRYKEQAKAQCLDFEVVEAERPWLIRPFLEHCNSIGYEEEFLTVSVFGQCKAAAGEDRHYVPVSQGLSGLRLIKTEAELATLQKAVDIADDAFRHILPFIKAGVLEIEIATEMDFFMRKQGATGSSFDFIIAGGTRSALPHGVAGKNPIQANEPLLMDYGCVYENYCSDITRTVFVGDIDPELKQLYYIVKEGQQRAYRKAYPGIKISSAEKATRSFFAESDLEQYFGHSLGHGVGLEIHEAPTVNKKNDAVFEDGMVFTIEPGIYIPEVGGVRIEDMVRMTQNGPFTMTGAPKDLIIL